MRINETQKKGAPQQLGTPGVMFSIVSSCCWLASQLRDLVENPLALREDCRHRILEAWQAATSDPGGLAG